MSRQVALSGSTFRDVARTLKRGFDDLQETDSGWRYVQFDHPAFGREPADTFAERIPGALLVSSVEPGDDADALVAVVGYVDSFTDEVHLGNGMVVPGVMPKETTHEGYELGEYPNRRMPAVALYDDGGVTALIGSVHETRESRFEPSGLGEHSDAAIREWLEDIDREASGSR